jgi:hypothetical protein
MTIILAATHHDPDGRLLAQAARVLPSLRRHFAEAAIFLTAQTVAEADGLLTELGAEVRRGHATMPIGHAHLGLWRRAALASAVATWPATTGYLFCDLDRALHWAEYYPDELGVALEAAQGYDCMVYGRTARAFASHPRVQRETETLANHGFSLASGLSWDVMTAARGLSRAAAELIVTRCSDDTVGSDCSWPLLCRQAGLRLGYLETEGMEFETLDRYADELAALGGREAWLARFDADVQQWLTRVELARAEIASAIAYTQ